PCPVRRLTQPEMSEMTTVPVAARAPEPKADALPLDQVRERRSCLLRQWPCRKVGPAERQLRRLEPDQTNLAAVVQANRVAVHHLDDGGGGPGVQRYRR